MLSNPTVRDAEDQYIQSYWVVFCDMSRKKEFVEGPEGL